MKVAFLVDHFPSVSETFVMNQVVGLIRRGHDVRVFAPIGQAPAVIHEEVRRFNLLSRTTYCDEWPEPFAEPDADTSTAAQRVRWKVQSIVGSALRMEVARAAAEFRALVFPRRVSGRFDVIHCHFGPNGQRACMLRNSGQLSGPVVTTFHGYDANLLPRKFGPHLYRKLFAEGEVVTVGSEFMRGKVCGLGATPERVHKIPMGVDVSRFTPRSGPRKPGRLRVLMIGRLVEVKGVDYLIRALALLRDRGHDVEVTVGGGGDLRRKLEQLAADLGVSDRVTFAGPVTHEIVATLLADADLFVLSSVVTSAGEEDSQAVVLAEAQAAGIPVVASAIGGIPESLNDGVTGLLVPSRDPSALADAIGQLDGDSERRVRMGIAGRDFIEQHFDDQKLLERLLQTYESVQ